VQSTLTYGRIVHLLRFFAYNKRAHLSERVVLQMFPGLGKLTHRYTRRGEDGFDKPWEKDEPDIKVKCVCQECNGGWMDRLDHKAEDLFLTRASMWA